MSYKRRELKLHNDGFYGLASAVIRQWNMDGRPRNDMQSIINWAQLMQAHNKLSNAIHNGSVMGISKRR